LGLRKVGYGSAMARKLHQLQICVHTVIVNYLSLNQIYSFSEHSKVLITIPEYGLPGEHQEIFVMSLKTIHFQSWWECGRGCGEPPLTTLLKILWISKIVKDSMQWAIFHPAEVDLEKWLGMVISLGVHRWVPTWLLSSMTKWGTLLEAGAWHVAWVVGFGDVVGDIPLTYGLWKKWRVPPQRMCLVRDVYKSGTKTDNHPIW